MLQLNKIPAVFLFIGLLCASNLFVHGKSREGELKQRAKYYQGIVFEAKPDDRLMLIDSAIFFGLQTEDPALIGDLYLTKGTVYYSFKNYQLTLEQYLIAYDYIQRSGDPYGLHSVKNMIANLKNYLGYYQDAEELFQECVNYFGQDESNYNLHRGWVNSMMGLAWSLTKRGELTESVQILSEARESTQRMGFSELDQVYNEDHRFLLSTIYKKYTTQDLRHAKASLESALQAERSKSVWLIGFSNLLVVFLLAGIYYGGKKSKIRKTRKGEATQLRSDVVEQLLEKLSQFEQKEGFLQPNITLESMAADFRMQLCLLVLFGIIPERIHLLSLRNTRFE